MTNPYDTQTGQWLTPFSWAPIAAANSTAAGTGTSIADIISALGQSGSNGGKGATDQGYAGTVNNLSDFGKAALGGVLGVLGGPMAGPMAIGALVGSGGKSTSPIAALASALGFGSHSPSVMGNVTNDLTSGEFGGKTGEISSSVGNDAAGSGLGGSNDIGAQGDVTAEARGFATGGYTGDIPRGTVAGPVHGQEFVFSAPATAAIGPDVLAALNAALSGRAAPFGWGTR